MRRVINSTYVSLDGLIELLDRWHFGYLDDASDLLFREGNTAKMTLVDPKALPSGVVILADRPEVGR